MTNLANFALTKCGPRLRRGWGYSFVWALGHFCDAALDAVSWALRARFLSEAPADALYYAGRDRMMVRGPDEDDARWSARLAETWGAWAPAGTEAGIRAQLEATLPAQVAVTFVEGSWWFGVILTPADQTWRDAAVTETVSRILAQFRPAHVVARHVAVEGTLLAWGHHGTAEWGSGWPDPTITKWSDDAVYLVEDSRAV